ncbi:MAG: hypothetical protein PHC51_05460 [bacterium]|nr:hypothetical protein [bacterium]
MSSEIKYLLCMSLIMSLSSCKSPEDNLANEKKVGRENVEDAKVSVSEARQDATDKIREAQGSQAVDSAKIQATKDIATAKHELGDAKVEATKGITKAETEAEKEESPAVP